MSVEQEMLRKHLVSSTNNRVSILLVHDGRSFIYIMKSIGPRMLPCGTPEMTGFDVDKELLIRTF